MKMWKRISITTVFIVSLYGFSGCDTPSSVSIGVHYANPAWAPLYYHGVRYYYLPDIECYYDLAHQEFVYLDHGQWLFSPVLPPVYAPYNLYTGFVVALNIDVYQPWLHHQYYVSHYPRYYYHNYYHDRNLSMIRGFNENERKAIFWKQEDRNRIDDLRKNEGLERKPDNYRMENPRPPQLTNYYRKNIGQPVKVKPYMRENNVRKPVQGKEQ